MDWLKSLSWIDHTIVVVYLGGMLAFGVYLSRKRRSDEEYFLAGRRMPWLAVGISIVASMLSSLSYLSEPGEVWKSGVTHVAGKLLGIPFEMLVVWGFCIPFMMRFRYTSAYEYLGDRFGVAARRLGVLLFLGMVVLWMGFVVLASAKALHVVTGIPIPLVILVLGTVATVYTMLGGLRAVVWTDVVQVALLTGGGIATIVFVIWQTGTWLPDWLATASDYVSSQQNMTAIPWFSWDPTLRATVVTVAVNMFVWHLCMHTSNQITVQRYFSTDSPQSARRGFLASSIIHVAIDLLLVTVGLAVLYYYVGQGIEIDGGLSPENDRDLIFPVFAMNRLPAGCGGAILAALLAAAMSTIDSGVNSIATVITVELGSREQKPAHRSANHVGIAMMVTLTAGAFITAAAYAISFLPAKWGIVGAIPRTFNMVTGPLGGLFLVGIFMSTVGQRAAIVATVLGLITSVVMGYLEQIGGLLGQLGVIDDPLLPISFTWILPCSLLVTLVTAPLLRFLDPSSLKDTTGLSWKTRR